jgi:hypothetical protein
MMMRRGRATADRATEGAVSGEIVNMRVSLDYPVVPDTLLEVRRSKTTICCWLPLLLTQLSSLVSLQIIDAYLNMTLFLQESSFELVDIDNSLDIYWPLPNIFFSALVILLYVSIYFRDDA